MNTVPIECIHPATAETRAEEIVAGLGLGWQEGFWAGGAQQVLRCYLMAAAILGVDLADVQQWTTDPHGHDALDALRSRPDLVPPRWIADFDACMTQAPDVIGGILATVRAALGNHATPAELPPS